ncbi:MAG: hypothetical protein Q8M06_05515 [Methanobacteriaceae archaeon]|nr:hypothetical protein [Methanobacteriaceae archaeon]
MPKKFYQKSAFKLFVAIIVLAIVLFPAGVFLEKYYPPQKADEIASMSIGDTVLEGMDVVDDNKIRKVPFISHPTYIIEYAKDSRFLDILEALLTGVVRIPISKMTSSSVSRFGIAQGFEGPGILIVTGDKLEVKSPGTFVWGFKMPHTYAVKTSKGLDIMENNKTIKTVAYDNINNDTIFHQYVSVNELKQWYNDSDNNDKIAINFGIDNFTDGRNYVSPDKIKSLFGDSAVDYMVNYPEGSPVMVYMNGYTAVNGSSVVSYLGSYPQYDDSKRAYNARSFSAAWNGTIIPPQTVSSGKETVDFTSSRDPKAPGGYASHGSCPPARALRAISAGANFPLPRGMTWEHDAVLYGFNPATGIRVYNSGENPVQIIMWTSGNGGNTRIFAKMIELVPN